MPQLQSPTNDCKNLLSIVIILATFVYAPIKFQQNLKHKEYKFRASVCGQKVIPWTAQALGGNAGMLHALMNLTLSSTFPSLPTCYLVSLRVLGVEPDLLVGRPGFP